MRKQELEPGQKRRACGDSLDQTTPDSPTPMGDNKAIYMGVNGQEVRPYLDSEGQTIKSSEENVGRWNLFLFFSSK